MVVFLALKKPAEFIKQQAMGLKERWQCVKV
jgi:hypothetical protein